MIFGRVVSRHEGDTLPWEGAQVYLSTEVNCGALTDSLGRHTLYGVPSGEHTLVVRLIGFETDSLRVTVSGDTAHASFELVPTEVRLHEEPDWVRPLSDTSTRR